MSKILLADDDLSTRQFLTAALQKAGHEVTACADGLEAWGTFQAAPSAFDLLLTDIVMPGLDGMELSSRARGLCPALKIVYITGFAAMADNADANDKVISKPFHLGNLTREIDALLKL